ncbi:MAG: sigma 54-interacting transcriptional regulator [Deltaproteobacteria bacterium]|nr:sigma 54-interacting transcriptional regulator [Deltaproteobacteria bacterium]
MLPEGQVDRDGEILIAVGGVLHREIAIDDLLRRMVDHICTTMEADRGTIYLLDRGKGELFSKVAHLPELEEIRLALGQGVAGHVAQTGDVVNVPTASTEARFYAGVDAQTGYSTESILAVPMRDHTDAIIGVVQLLNKAGGRFTHDDEQSLARLAGQAALAIEATTVYEDLARAPESQLEPLPISGQFNRIVGESELLRAACHRTRKAAASEATVLVTGESGTGKELFVRAIHVNSARADGPFAKVDCAALPETLIANELFGHEAGAYTGADRKALGKFDAAQGGTIFLDEIGELPLSVQGKLLRVLQDREFLRVGGTEPVSADVRVVAATNRDLEKLIAEGRFRSDLYFRIKVVEIKLPPLRDRGPRDIARLCTHFIAGASKRHGRTAPRLSDEARRRLEAYPWPGNVRELENCIESAIVVMDGPVIEPEDLPLPERLPQLRSLHPATAPGGAAEGRPQSSVSSLAEVERRHILRVLNKVDGNRTLAAKLLGIGRNTLARKLKKYGA